MDVKALWEVKQAMLHCYNISNMSLKKKENL